LNYKIINIQFLLLFLGANITFFPQHFLGLTGMPRRYSDYNSFLRLWNIISSIGSILSIFSLFLFSYIIFESFTRQRQILRLPLTSNIIEWKLRPYPMENHVHTETLEWIEIKNK
jgi:cytochrome c oxidase subunit 1